MPVTSLKTKPIWVWIPPIYSPLYKITITRNDGTVDDVTDDIIKASVTDGATDIIGSFRLTLLNGDESYTGRYTGNESFKFYCDYDLTATTLRFSGIIEKVAYGETNIVITGRSEALLVFGKTVTQNYTNQEVSTILTDLVSKYGDSKFTTTNVSVTTTNVTVSWTQKPFWDCIRDLCHASGYDCYIDVNRDFNFFLIGSRLNTTDAMVHDYNIISAPPDFGTDKAEIRNRVIVYGAEIGGLPNVWTAEDTSLQTSMNRVQEVIITDSNLKTQDDVRERATNELAYLIQEKQLGSRTSVGLATIQPGQKIRISDPYNNISPADYPFIQYTHNIDFNDEFVFTTEVQLNRLPISLARLMKGRIEAEQNLGNITNQFSMNYSYNIPFDDDSLTESHSNTYITNGVLRTGAIGGIWTSLPYSTIDMTSGELKVVGNNLDAVYEVSGNGGVTWQQIQPNTQFNITGNTLKIKITLNSISMEMDSVVVLYK
jgi:hypothetical protein